jgi:hypothetical protein
MTRTPPTSWFNRITLAVVGVVTAALVVVGFVVQGQGWGQFWPTLLVVLVVAGLVIAWLQPWLGKRRTRRHLAGRLPMDAATFGTIYFSDLPQGPETAAAVRGHLEAHLGMELPGLRPDDRFADLGAGLDPLFFDDLARDFGFNPPKDFPEFSALASSLPTVRDLVEYVVQQSKPGE